MPRAVVLSMVRYDTIVLCVDRRGAGHFEDKKITDFFLRAKHTNFYKDPWNIIMSEKVPGRSILTVLSGWIDVL
jgi:hypothetical protein